MSTCGKGLNGSELQRTLTQRASNRLWLQLWQALICDFGHQLLKVFEKKNPLFLKGCFIGLYHYGANANDADSGGNNDYCWAFTVCIIISPNPQNTSDIGTVHICISQMVPLSLGAEDLG